MFTIETTHGTIRYDETILRNIVEKGVEELDGRALLYNNTKRIPGLGTGRKQASALTTGGANTIRIENDEENGIEITVYLVVRFGASISEVTNQLIDYIYEYMGRITRMRPVKVTVHVTGVLSRNLVRRDIEVSR